MARRNLGGTGFNQNSLTSALDVIDGATQNLTDDGLLPDNAVDYAIENANFVLAGPTGAVKTKDKPEFRALVSADIPSLDASKIVTSAGADIPYSSGNFTASGSMTWTVQSGDQTLFRYVKIAQLLFLWFELDATTTGGTASTDLIFQLPNGLKAAAATDQLYHYFDGTPPWAVGHALTTVGSSSVILHRTDNGGTNWPVPVADAVYARGLLIIEVQP